MASPWGEGFFCRAIFKKLGFSHQLSQSAKSDSRAQPLPRGSEQRSWTQGWRSQTEGEKQEANGGKLAFIRAVQAFTCHGAQNVSAAFQFYSTDFHVTTQPSLILSLYAPRYCLTASAGFGRQFAKLRALSRLRRRYGSKKESFPRSPPHSITDSQAAYMPGMCAMVRAFSSPEKAALVSTFRMGSKSVSLALSAEISRISCAVSWPRIAVLSRIRNSLPVMPSSSGCARPGPSRLCRVW